MSNEQPDKEASVGPDSLENNIREPRLVMATRKVPHGVHTASAIHHDLRRAEMEDVQCTSIGHALSAWSRATYVHTCMYVCSNYGPLSCICVNVH